MADFENVLDAFQAALSKYPGDAELLKDLLRYGKKCLSNSRPDDAARIFETGIRQVGGSPYLNQLRSLLEFSYTWLTARRHSETGNLVSAVESLSRQLEFSREYKEALSDEVQSWFKSADKHSDLEAARKIKELASSLTLGDYRFDLVGIENRVKEQEIESNKRRKENLEGQVRDLNSRYLQVLNTENSEGEKVKKLEAMLNSIRVVQQGEAENSDIYQTLQSMLNSVQSSLSSLKQNQQIAEQKEKAGNNEKEAERKIKTLDSAQLQMAIKLLGEAESLYQTTGETQAVLRVRELSSLAKIVSENIVEIQQMRLEFNAKLESIESHRKNYPKQSTLPDALATSLDMALLALARLHALMENRGGLVTGEFDVRIRKLTTQLGWNNESLERRLSQVLEFSSGGADTAKILKLQQEIKSQLDESKTQTRQDLDDLSKKTNSLTDEVHRFGIWTKIGLAGWGLVVLLALSIAIIGGFFAPGTGTAATETSVLPPAMTETATATATGTATVTPTQPLEPSTTITVTPTVTATASPAPVESKIEMTIGFGDPSWELYTLRKGIYSDDKVKGVGCIIEPKDEVAVLGLEVHKDNHFVYLKLKTKSGCEGYALAKLLTQVGTIKKDRTAISLDEIPTLTPAPASPTLTPTP